MRTETLYALVCHPLTQTLLPCGRAISNKPRGEPSNAHVISVGSIVKVPLARFPLLYQAQTELRLCKKV